VRVVGSMEHLGQMRRHCIAANEYSQCILFFCIVDKDREDRRNSIQFTQVVLADTHWFRSGLRRDGSAVSALRKFLAVGRATSDRRLRMRFVLQLSRQFRT
jgi:hypothetical protein